MIINRTGAGFVYDGTMYKIGEPVIGTKESAYEGLYGIITEIRDGEDKNAETKTPDFYCTFRPPVLPCEIKALEARFSSLYAQPKTLPDIAMDAIMAPSMVMPLEGVEECGYSPKLYVLLEDWSVNGNHNVETEIYSDLNAAKHSLYQKVADKQESGCVRVWRGEEGFTEKSTPDSYNAYPSGDYTENHYAISIVSQNLHATHSFVRETADAHEASCQLEDFAEWVEENLDWGSLASLNEVKSLTDEQYKQMVHDSRFPQWFQKALGRSDNYWDAYWATMSDVAPRFIRMYLDEIKASGDTSHYGEEA